MPKNRVNEKSIEYLQLRVDELEKENTKLWNENHGFINDVDLYRDILNSVITEPSYWSESAVKSGITQRIKKLTEK